MGAFTPTVRVASRARLRRIRGRRRARSPGPRSRTCRHGGVGRGRGDPAAEPGRAARPSCERLLAQLRPTHCDDATAAAPYADGVPAPAGTAAIVVTSGTTGDAQGRRAHARRHGGDGPRLLRRARRRTRRPLARVPPAAPRRQPRRPRARVRHRRAVDRARRLRHRSRRARRRGPRERRWCRVVPTTLRRLLDAGAPMHEYRRVIVGGAPCPPALRARAEAARRRVVDAYGMTETWGGWALDGVPIAGAERAARPPTARCSCAAPW